MNIYAIRIFDGENTYLYTCSADSKDKAESKIVNYLKAIGKKINYTNVTLLHKN